MSERKPNSFIWFMKKICADYQLNKADDDDYTRLNAANLARMASYHWSHMTDIEKEPYRRAALLQAMPETSQHQNCKTLSYIR